MLCKQSVKKHLVVLDMDGFNSLRTGKCFASDNTVDVRIDVLTGKFQFPPNGKVLCKRIQSRIEGDRHRWVSIPSERESALQEMNEILSNVYYSVSIPSERESALQAYWKIDVWSHTLRFHFPPNGKVLCKTFVVRSLLSTQHSSFNSLRTGKCFASEVCC